MVRPVLHMVIFVSVLLSQFVPLSPSLAVSTSLFSMSGSLSCPVNRFINTLFLDSIHMCVNIWYLFFWLTSLCIRGSWFIYLTRTDSNLFLFMAGLVFHCVYIPQLLYPFIYGSTKNPPHVLAIVNSTAMNIELHVSFSTMIFSGYVLSRGIVG